MDLSKLNSLFENIKDLDIAQVSRMLAEKRDILIKSALVVGALMVAAAIFNKHHVKDQSLRDQISQAQQKLDVIKARDASVEDINKFKASLPKSINEFELITLISDYAKLHNIVIPSLSPTDNRDLGLHSVINVNFDATADSFKDMMLFLRKIEKSDVPLRIDSWMGRQEEDGKIVFTIKVSLVVIHP